MSFCMSGFSMNVRCGCVGGTLNVCMGVGMGLGAVVIACVTLELAFMLGGACDDACDCFGKNDWAGAFTGVVC